jgi:polysaccharide pyruvyl transferase WcaK-like protein
MSWEDDVYWVAACEAALRAADEADLVLVPTEFLGRSPRFAFLDYAWALDPGARRIAWCCPKDDADRLAPWVHAAHGDPARLRWANEVFVLEGNFAWSEFASRSSLRNWLSWVRRIRRCRKGLASRPAAFRIAAEGVGSAALRVLVVGASGMGNVGDDLVAEVIAERLREHCGARVALSGPDVDLTHLRDFDAVVVGGGGLIYERRGDIDEAQNLVNYLKFGFAASHFGIPALMLGVGDQQDGPDPEKGSWRADYISKSLRNFRLATTRDPQSAALLQRWGLRDVRPGCDLLFGAAAHAAHAVRPAARQPARLAIGGELLGVAAMRALLEDDAAAAVADLASQEVDLLVMSNDDVPHLAFAQERLAAAGVTASLVDLRGKPFAVLVYTMASYDALITTRFHGLVMAALCGVPVLAFSSESGKIARLLSRWGQTEHLVLAHERSTDALLRVRAALRGEISPIRPDVVQGEAQEMHVHLDALSVLCPPRDQAAEFGSVQAANDRPQVRDSARHRLDVVRRERFRLVESVGLCWAASSRQTGGYANLGDSLSAVVTSALSGKRIQHVAFDAPGAKLVAVGSIAHAISQGEAVIWGTGVSIRAGVLAQNVPLTRYDVRAVRGEISAQHLRDFGIDVPNVYGDPVWILPSIFSEPVEKRYELGVIPHIQDIEGTSPESPPRSESLRCVIDEDLSSSIIVLNTWHEPTWEGIKAKLRLMLSCKRIVSQSFHGVVIAEAYGIPVLHFRQYRGARRNGQVRINLRAPCRTDPRVWEFYKGGRRPQYVMYAQRRGERTDWSQVVRCIDTAWRPFRYDPGAMLDAFPLPLAYDPLRGKSQAEKLLKDIRF